MIARPNHRARRGAVTLLFAALAWPTIAVAQYTDVPPPAAYALTGVTVVQADGRRAEGMTVIVRDAFIEAIGAGIAVPPDAEVLEGDSLVVYPGFVDAHGTAEYAFPTPEIDRSQIESWDPPRNVQGFMPHRRVVDFLTATGADLQRQRRRGVVAAAVHPTDAMMPGRGAFLVFRQAAETPMRLVHAPMLGPVFTFRGGRGVYPATLFGVLAFYRQAFEDAGRMRLIAAEFAEDPHGIRTPSYDPDYAVLQEVMGGGTPVYFAVDRAEDIRRALDLAERYDLRPVILGGREAWQVAGRLAAADVPVLASLDFPEPERWDPDAEPDSTTAEEASDPDVLREKSRLEESYANAARLSAAGVRFALTSGGGEAALLEGARRAIEYGLSEADALRALTATPAALFGAPHLARIEAGLPATFIVADGPLFDEETKLVYTFVEGALEEAGVGEGAGGEPPAVDLTGGWTVELDSPQGSITATMTLEQDGASFTGSIEAAEFGTLSVRGGNVSGNDISFTIVVDAGGQTIEMRVTGTATADEMSGSGGGPMGDFDFTARRTSGPGGGAR